jgi:molybdenum cofactor cytidylyltransferase
LIALKCTIEHCCIVILAAGKSNRLGSPKQLLSFKGKSLLKHAAEAAIGTGLKPVIVITGSRAHLMEKELENYPVQLVFNENWEEGMASSIRCGVEAAQGLKPEADGILFMVCDQPFAVTSVLKELIARQKETGMPITACVYENITGTPALYHKSIFPELNTLTGDIGARKIISKHSDELAVISFSSGKTDIDTGSDYENLLKTIN